MIKINKTSAPKAKPDLNGALGFGRYFTDHMFEIDYSTNKGWYDPRVVPYGPIPLDPGASILHYGQAIFEGMKCFYQEGGRLVLFRPEFNWKRMLQSAERLCMPFVDESIFLEALHKLVSIERDWVPRKRGSSLYVRPTLLGTEPFLGVRPADEYLFYIILSPVANYYTEGLSPLKIWVERKYVRAVPGGLGEAKAAANYAGSLKAAFAAKKKGYAQVLWLDGNHHYVEEVGTMNVFFVFKDEIVTPSLDGSILAGGMRDSVLQVLRRWGERVVERKLSMAEVVEGAQSGRLLEAFGTGTAAVISPIGELADESGTIKLSQCQIGPLAQKLYEEIQGIQFGIRPDPDNWIVPVTGG